jgi:hypothetical protein
MSRTVERLKVIASDEERVRREIATHREHISRLEGDLRILQWRRHQLEAAYLVEFPNRCRTCDACDTPRKCTACGSPTWVQCSTYTEVYGGGLRGEPVNYMCKKCAHI